MEGVEGGDGFTELVKGIGGGWGESARDGAEDACAGAVFLLLDDGGDEGIEVKKGVYLDD